MVKIKRIKTKGISDSRQCHIHDTKTPIRRMLEGETGHRIWNYKMQEMYVKEQKEHPSFTDEQIKQIVFDHIKSGKTD